MRISTPATVLASLTSATALAIGGLANAEPMAILHPNIETTTGDRKVTIGGRTLVNHGLVGLGRLSASGLDFAGETLGSFSGMALQRWTRAPNGTYVGRLLTLPDRGPNDVGGVVGTTDYRNRVHAFDITFRPGGQLTLKPAGGMLLQDQTGQYFTGKDGAGASLVRAGVSYPSPASGEGAGRISMDSEALALLPNGDFYVGDEYAANIYLFNAKGRQIGVIPTVPAIAPHTGGKLNLDGGKAPESGRRNNQGMEGLSVTPDGKHLIAVLQSATVQDTGSGAQTRNHTRVLVYDISKTRTPKMPVGHYVIELPVFASKGDKPNTTAAQSEALALNDHQFLLLSRDGIGRGSDPKGATSALFKSILAVDLKGATNLAGTAFESEPAGAVSPGGELLSTITPANSIQVVNLLNPTELARLGLNLNTLPSDTNSLSEKWEAMALAPSLDPKAPNDVFLLVGNDNDFITAKGRENGKDFDASLSGDGGTGDSDNLILVYHLSLLKN